MSILNRLHKNSIIKEDETSSREIAGLQSKVLKVDFSSPLNVRKYNKKVARNELKNTQENNGRTEVSQSWETYFNDSPVTMIETMTAWEDCKEVIALSRLVALDTETTGLDPHQSRIRFLQIGIPQYIEGKGSFCMENLKEPHPGSRSQVYIVDCFQLEPNELQEVIDEVVQMIENPEVVTIFHHATFDLKMIRSVYGKRFDCRVFDTMIASQLVQAGYFIPENQLPVWCVQNHYRCERQDNRISIIDDYTKTKVNLMKDNQKYYKPYYYRHGLADVAHRHLGIILDKTEQTSQWSGKVSQEMIEYAAKDVKVLIPVYEILDRLIKINQLEKVAEIEFSCIGATAEIEYVGMPFNSLKAQEIQASVKEELAEQTEALVELIKQTGFRAKNGKTEQFRTMKFRYSLIWS